MNPDPPPGPLAEAFLPWPRTAAAVALPLAGAAAFLRFALPEPHPFAAAALALLAAAVFGPFLVRGSLRGLLRCAALAAAAALLCRSPLLGLFAGLYAFAAGAVADLLRARLARLLVASVAAALLGTLLYWDALGSGKEHAALGFRLSALAAVSVHLDFDWIHAKALYTDNLAAEALAGVERKGIGPFALACAAVAAAAAGLRRVAPWRS